MRSSKQKRHSQYFHYHGRTSLLSRVGWLYLAAGSAVVFMLYLLLSSVMDTHGGAAYTAALCEEFQQLRLSGSLCAELCRDRTLQLRNFVQDDNGYRIFEWGDRLYKVRLSHLKHLEVSSRLQHIYAVPSDGTTIEQFSKMMEEFIVNKLGDVDHRELLNQLLDTADVNKDSQISLGEAKTMWALLQHDEVFKLLLFSNSEYIQQFKGHCGDLYALEKVDHKYLYHKSKSPISNFLFPYRYAWWFPDWVVRAKVVVGLMEFTLDAYQHGSLGTFHMCRIDESAIGYTRRGDVKIMHIDGMLSRQELADIVGARSCENSSDCVYVSHCRTVCDSETKRCTADLVKPNLSVICSVVRPYILKGAPRIIKGDLLHILEKCDRLEHGQEKLELNHSLILNDLKLLLWKQIQNSRF